MKEQRKIKENPRGGASEPEDRASQRGIGSDVADSERKNFG